MRGASRYERAEARPGYEPNRPLALVPLGNVLVRERMLGGVVWSRLTQVKRAESANT